MRGRESAEKRRKEVLRQQRQRDKAERKKLRRQERHGEGDDVSSSGLDAASLVPLASSLEVTPESAATIEFAPAEPRAAPLHAADAK